MEALDLHLRQWEWSTTAAAAEVWRNFAESYGIQGRDKHYRFLDETQAYQRAAFFNEVDAQVMNEGRTVYVTAEIMDLVEPAAGSMPNAKLSASLLPHRHGVMIFERPLDYWNLADGERIPLRAVAWWSAKVETTDGEAVDGITMICYGDTERVIDMRLGEGVEGWPRFLGAPPPLFPTDVTGWAFDARWAEAEDDDHMAPEEKASHIAQLRRFMLSLWTFMADEIVPVERHPHLSRAVEKRAKRGWPKRTWEDGMATVVHFRRIRPTTREPGDDGEEREPVLRTHSWIVSGHWRKLRDKETGQFEGRVTWVRPHIKGDGPLVIKERISIVNR